MSKPLRMLMLALAALMLPGLAAADPHPAFGLLLSPVFAAAALADEKLMASMVGNALRFHYTVKPQSHS